MMKKTILLVLVLSATIFNLKAQDEVKKEEVNWLTFEEALALNKETPKKFFIDFYTHWCGWCKRLDATTFKDPAIVTLLNENYYPIKFNAEGKDTIRFQNREYVYYKAPEARRGYQTLAVALMKQKMSFPTMTVMTVESDSEDVTFINNIPGFLQTKDLEPILDYFTQDLHVKQIPFEEYKANYYVDKSGTPDPKVAPTERKVINP